MTSLSDTMCIKKANPLQVVSLMLFRECNFDPEILQSIATKPMKFSLRVPFEIFLIQWIQQNKNRTKYLRNTILTALKD